MIFKLIWLYNRQSCFAFIKSVPTYILMAYEYSKKKKKKVFNALQFQKVHIAQRIASVSESRVYDETTTERANPS